MNCLLFVNTFERGRIIRTLHAQSRQDSAKGDNSAFTGFNKSNYIVNKCLQILAN